ncbi:FadR/GntR family transcriptional regulator [Pseudonocardia sp. H11422]|uniref:FadR/GntR family transcriptional regulator n=1 Tax=Pseudonocardia sp. H11422 TaxID=2835866 RepID=UPI001BDD0E64|nr:FadR/GntR family transcriptional regulator [Pseudonocardia sp. H11422]
MSAADRAIQKIRDLIVEGDLGPGHRLPAEAELASRLQVSRNSLREAVRALCEARVLEIRRGDGTFVSNLQPQTLLGGLGFALDLMRGGTLLEIFEVRRLLEPAATGLAALRATEQDIADLTESLYRLNEARNDEELISFDLEFHRRVVVITGNATLCTLMDALGTRAMGARVWRGVVQEGTRNFTFEQHSRIVEAIAAGDPTLASAASTVHVSASEAWLRQALTAAEDAGDSGGPVELFNRQRRSVLQDTQPVIHGHESRAHPS